MTIQEKGGRDEKKEDEEDAWDSDKRKTKRAMESDVQSIEAEN